VRGLKLVSVLAPLVALAALLLGAARPAQSYLPEPCLSSATGPSCTANTLVPLHWSRNSFPIQYNVNPTVTGARIGGSRTVGAVIDASFAVWMAAPNTNLVVTRGGDSSVAAEASPPNASNINLICFVCTDTNFAADASTLAVTLFTFATAPGGADGHGGVTQFAGQIIKADILFNPTPSPPTPNSVPTSLTTDPASAVLNSSANVVDLQTIALHEIGHFLGLDHSAVTNAVMFPFASTIPRETLASDDVAVISMLYPGTQSIPVGSMQGTVRFQAGGGVFGAHVFADSTTSLAGYGGTVSVRKGPIGALTDPSGNYTIQGLPVDSYAVTAEPLDLPVTNADIAAYAPVYGQAAVQTSFTSRQH
jgi:hypothetical protein